MVNYSRVEAFARLNGKKAAPTNVYLHIVVLTAPHSENGIVYTHKVCVNDPTLMHDVYCRDITEANDLAVNLSKQSGIKIRREGFDKLRQPHEF